jgi:RHS repeat-associated protein
MATTNYYSLNGEIIGEKTIGGTRTDYLTDALGSVTATLNQSAQVVNTYRHKPSGAQLAKTGVGADPAFRWVGKEGYRQTGKKWSSISVRLRHYDTDTGRWTTKDPLGIRFPKYTYVRTNPTTLVDPIGLLAGGGAPCKPNDPQCSWPSILIDFCIPFAQLFADMVVNYYAGKNRGACLCEVDFKGDITINVKACLFFSGAKPPGTVTPCWLSESFDCGAVSAQWANSCSNQPGCYAPCGQPKSSIVSANIPINLLPSWCGVFQYQNPFGIPPVLTFNPCLEQMTGSIDVEGTVTIKHCVGCGVK